MFQGRTILTAASLLMLLTALFPEESIRAQDPSTGECKEVPFVYSLAMLNALPKDTKSIEITGLQDADLKVLTSFTALESVQISSTTNVTDQGMEVVAKLPQLKAISILNLPKVTDATLKLLIKNKTLRKLSISTCPGITAKGLANLRKMKALQSLRLQGEELSDKLISNLLKGLTNLEELKVSGQDITDKSSSSIRRLKKLKKLGMNNTSLSLNGLRSLVALKKLEELDLRGCKQLQKKDATILNKFKNLKHIKVSGKFSLGLEKLKPMASIESIDLNAISSATVLAALTPQRFSALKKVTLDDCQGITAAELAPLKGLGLEALDISWLEDIQAEDLKTIGEFKTLKHLALRDELRAQANLIKELRAALPNCRFEYR